MFSTIVKVGQTLGTAAITAGIVNEYFLYDVDAGTRAVIFDKFNGIQQEVKGEGTHIKIPFFQVSYHRNINLLHLTTNSSLACYF